MLVYNLRELLPAPDAAPAVAETADGEPVEITADAAAPTCAYVFKTVADPFVGKLSFIKVLAGKLTAASNVVNARTGQPERMGKTLTVCGKRQTDAAAIPAGDIGAVAKLSTAKTGDTLCDPARVVSLPAPAYPAACYRMAVKVAKKGDEGKVSGALARLMEEDPAITFTVDPETKQQVIAGLGTQHLEVAVAKLRASSAWRSRSKRRACPTANPSARAARPRAATKSRPAATASSATSGFSSSPAKATRSSSRRRCSAAACQELLPRGLKRACARRLPTVCWPGTRWSA